MAEVQLQNTLADHGSRKARLETMGLQGRLHKVERKHVFYQKVDGKTFAVGYYLSRSSEAAAKALLDEVIELDNPHLVLSTLHLALRGMGLGKVLSQPR